MQCMVGWMRGQVGAVLDVVGMMLGLAGTILVAFAEGLRTAAHLESWSQPVWQASAEGMQAAELVGRGVGCHWGLVGTRCDMAAADEDMAGAVFDLVGGCFGSVKVVRHGMAVGVGCTVVGVGSCAGMGVGSCAGVGVGN